MTRLKNISGTHQKLLTLLLVGVFFSVPLVTHAAFDLSGIIIGITGYILYVAAGLFDASIDFFVLKMGGLITGSTGIGIGVSINVIWTTVRDLVNLTFIFGLVYIGFKTILDADTDTKKLLSSIIIGALLVNFSLFISKVVIDVSNVTASEIYKAMKIGNGPRNSATGKPLSVSETFMSQMGILKLVSPDDSTQKDIVGRFAGAGINVTDSYLAFTVGAAIFILVASFVFAAGAFLLAIRFGVLVILMMLSPIFFAATVFPVFRGWRDKWLHSLLSQAFFAPAYLFMIYVTLKVAEGYASQASGFDKIFTASTGFAKANFDTAIFFCLTIVMMVASLILAKQMGAIGASRMLAVGKKMRDMARRGALSPVSWAGRNIVGRLAERDLKNEDNPEKNKFLKRAVSIASFGALNERSRRNILKKVTEAKFGGSYSRADDVAYGKERAQKVGRSEAVRNIENAIASGATDPVKMQRVIAGATTEQLMQMLKGKKSTDPQYLAIVHHMAASKFDALMNAKPEDFDDAEKTALGQARRDSIVERLQEAGRVAEDKKNGTGAGLKLKAVEALQGGINTASAAQLKALGAETVADHAADLKQSQIDDIMKGTDFVEFEKAQIREARNNELIKRFNAKPTGFLSSMESETAVANLPKEILLNSFAIPQMTNRMLAKMEDTLGPSDRARIRKEIINNSYQGSGWLKSARGAEFAES